MTSAVSKYHQTHIECFMSKVQEKPPKRFALRCLMPEEKLHVNVRRRSVPGTENSMGKP